MQTQAWQCSEAGRSGRWSCTGRQIISTLVVAGRKVTPLQSSIRAVLSEGGAGSVMVVLCCAC